MIISSLLPILVIGELYTVLISLERAIMQAGSWYNAVQLAQLLQLLEYPARGTVGRMQLKDEFVLPIFKSGYRCDVTNY